MLFNIYFSVTLLTAAYMCNKQTLRWDVKSQRMHWTLVSLITEEIDAMPAVHFPLQNIELKFCVT